jgi:tRNA nucleotidyltransferase (CCA-adding enzyme)
LLKLHAAALSVRGADVMKEELQGPALGKALRLARIDAIRRARSSPL